MFFHGNEQKGVYKALYYQDNVCNLAKKKFLLRNGYLSRPKGWTPEARACPRKFNILCNVKRSKELKQLFILA